MNTLPEMFTAVAKQNAGRIAVVDGGQAIDYATLEKQMTVLARELHDRGVCPGDRVALLLPNGVDFVTSYFAIVTVGAIVVPLNDHYQQTELLYFLDVCGVSLVITSRAFAGLCQQVLALRKSPGTVFFVEDQPAASTGATLAVSEVHRVTDPEAPVMYQFSSGSTGRPKRIARTHAHLLVELESLLATLQVSGEDRFLGVAPFSHVNGLMRSMMASLRAGATLYPLAKFERRAVADLIEKNAISVFIGVPFMFSVLAKATFHRRPDFSSLRLCVSASAPMPQKLNQEFHQQFGMYVRQLYGSTETGTISVNLRPDIAGSLESVGTPLAGVVIEVLTEDGRSAECQEVGEVAVKSPTAITGYDNVAEGNQDAFRDGYFLTGDLGKRDQDGLLYLVGRKKFFINKGGYKINPHEIEALLESHPKVEEAVALGEPTAYGDERVKAVIVVHTPCTEEELVTYCQGKIADFKIPGIIEFRDTLPKSPTGKVRRKMLLPEGCGNHAARSP
ncbi:MAG: class I adenylate-forming enzyme family protein [Candidatus Binatia bacterium]